METRMQTLEAMKRIDIEARGSCATSGTIDRFGGGTRPTARTYTWGVGRLVASVTTNNSPARGAFHHLTTERD
jgi:hypothetical protein